MDSSLGQAVNSVKQGIHFVDAVIVVEPEFDHPAHRPHRRHPLGRLDGLQLLEGGTCEVLVEGEEHPARLLVPSPGGD